MKLLTTYGRTLLTLANTTGLPLDVLAERVGVSHARMKVVINELRGAGLVYFVRVHRRTFWRNRDNLKWERLLWREALSQPTGQKTPK